MKENPMEGRPQEDPVHVAFVAGAGLSGSTLLEQSLSQVEGCFSLGELYWMWKPYWPLMVCECGEQFRSCPFWQSVIDEVFGEEQEIIRARMESLGEGFIRHSVLPTILNTQPHLRIDEAFSELGAVMAAVYRSVARNAGASVVVDATKAALWGICASTSPEIELSIVRMVRDPRGFAFSNARSRAFHYPPGSRTTPRGTPRSYANWFVANISADWLQRKARRSAFVFYDRFSEDPAKAVRPVAMMLGLDPAANSAITHDALVIDRVGHAIGGNPRRPRRGTTPVKADEEWRRSAKPSVRALSPLVLPLWRRYRAQAGLPPSA
jgi:hypothetical protein